MQPDVSNPHPPPRALPVPRRIFFAILAGVLLVAAIAVVPLVAPLSWGLLVHYECGAGGAVAKVVLWTPSILVNAPYGGFANGTGQGIGTGYANGTAGGGFELVEWTISPSVWVLAAGPGANPICPGYTAAPAYLGSYAGYSFLRDNATSDLEENTSFSWNGQDSVIFHNGYSESDLSVDTCDSGRVILGVTASSITVEVPFALQGSNLTASATLHGAFNWTYSFPGHYGLWSIDDLSRGAHAPGGGWAFAFNSCV